jgi:hypothetical protein
VRPEGLEPSTKRLKEVGLTLYIPFDIHESLAFLGVFLILIVLLCSDSFPIVPGFGGNLVKTIFTSDRVFPRPV